jgi:hypothetical protein
VVTNQKNSKFNNESTLDGEKILRHAISHKQTTVVVSVPFFITTTLTSTTQSE